jgi:1-aminocyclopropane-1-carboxylate deaminase/D-cysteine desulfhydrase-like pyridoxal-dependent ACC family enzyme
MNHINVSQISTDLPIDLFIQDDSYYPLYGGGSKARKIVNFLKDAESEKCNAIVTAGAANSNHARVVALACASRGWKCTIVIHDQENYKKGNLLLMKMAGAKLIFTTLSHVAEIMNKEMENFKNEGYVPYYIYGGGHGIPGYKSYYEAALELFRNNQNLEPDYIIHASGTGGTQAGLIVGFNQVFPNAKVIGISVARKKDRGISAIQDACNELTAHLNQPMICSSKIIFRDDWVGEGYGSVYPELIKSIKLFTQKYGIVTDPTYVGKALHGLLSMINNGEIEKGSKVLFWHTGGLINLFEQTEKII